MLLANTKKIIITGNAGGGKSTLSRLLSKKLNIISYSIDHLQWRPGWKKTPADEYAHLHKQIMKKEQWIIDGVGAWDFLIQRAHAADLIIYVDLPLKTHFYWASKRQLKCLFKPRIDGPPGCPMLPMTIKLYQMMWFMHKKLRPRLLTLIGQCGMEKTQHIKSKKQLQLLLKTIA